MNNEYVEIDFDAYDDEFIDDLITFVNTMFPDSQCDDDDHFTFYYDRSREIFKIKIENIIDDTIELFIQMSFVDRIVKMNNEIDCKLNHETSTIYYVKRNRHFVTNTKRHLFIVDNQYVVRYDENDESIVIHKFDNEHEMHIIISMY